MLAQAARVGIREAPAAARATLGAGFGLACEGGVRSSGGVRVNGLQTNEATYQWMRRRMSVFDL